MVDALPDVIEAAIAQAQAKPMVDASGNTTTSADLTSSCEAQTVRRDDPHSIQVLATEAREDVRRSLALTTLGLDSEAIAACYLAQKNYAYGIPLLVSVVEQLNPIRDIGPAKDALGAAYAASGDAADANRYLPVQSDPPMAKGTPEPINCDSEDTRNTKVPSSQKARQIARLWSCYQEALIAERQGNLTDAYILLLKVLPTSDPNTAYLSVAQGKAIQAADKRVEDKMMKRHRSELYVKAAQAHYTGDVKQVFINNGETCHVAYSESGNMTLIFWYYDCISDNSVGREYFVFHGTRLVQHVQL